MEELIALHAELVEKHKKLEDAYSQLLTRYVKMRSAGARLVSLLDRGDFDELLVANEELKKMILIADDVDERENAAS